MKCLQFILFCVAILLAGCRTTKTIQGRLISIKPLPLSKIKSVDTVSFDDPRVARWVELGHQYTIDLSHVTHRYIFPRLRALDGKESLRLNGGAWVKYLNTKLASVGIRIEQVILTVPGHLAVIRSFEQEGRRRQVDCLIPPNAIQSDGTIRYNDPDYYSSENIAVRELHEFVAEDCVLIIDHLRDRSDIGDLSVVYILQDILKYSEKKMKRHPYFGALEHRNLFNRRCKTFEYIALTLSPITVSVLTSCRYQDFIPRNEHEEIPKIFLTTPELNNLTPTP